MKRSAVAVAMLAFLAACAADQKVPTANPDSQLSLAVGGNSELNGPWNAKVHPIRGANGAGAGNGAAARRSPNLTWHNGKIMTTSITRAIFWGTSWNSLPATDDKIAGLDLFYAGYGNTPFARTNIEYGTGAGVAPFVGQTSTYKGHIIDPTAASGGSTTTPILNEVCKVVTSNGIALDPAGNDYIAVYTDLPRGNAGFCAWHSFGSCGGKPVQFAFFWKLDGDAGCNPADNVTGHSQGLAALANVSAHELSEAVTDPTAGGGWLDGSGSENSDKCAWVFNATSVQTFSNGSKWKVQGNWSNAAYNSSTGYANNSGQLGCINQKL